MTRDEMKSALARARMNSRCLETCIGPHDFSVDIEPSRDLFKRWKCTRCGGEVDGIHKHYYELGLQHGRTKPA